MNSLPSIHSWIRISSSTISEQASVSSVSLFTLLVAMELPHRFGFTIYGNELRYNSECWILSGSPCGIKYVSGIFILISETKRFVWYLSRQRECTAKGEYAYLYPRVSRKAVIWPSSPYIPWNIGITRSKSWWLSRCFLRFFVGKYFAKTEAWCLWRKWWISDGKSKVSEVCPAIRIQSFIFSALRIATSRSEDIPPVRIAICIDILDNKYIKSIEKITKNAIFSRKLINN